MTSPNEANGSDPKSQAQAKLRNRIMQACMTATACTYVELVGALETVKLELMMRAVTAPPQFTPPTEPLIKGGN